MALLIDAIRVSDELREMNSMALWEAVFFTHALIYLTGHKLVGTIQGPAAEQGVVERLWAKEKGSFRCRRNRRHVMPSIKPIWRMQQGSQAVHYRLQLGVKASIRRRVSLAVCLSRASHLQATMPQRKKKQCTRDEPVPTWRAPSSPSLSRARGSVNQAFIIMPVEPLLPHAKEAVLAGDAGSRQIREDGTSCRNQATFPFTGPHGVVAVMPFVAKWSRAVLANAGVIVSRKRISMSECRLAHKHRQLTAGRFFFI